ncbi:hypothetical protein M1105_14585 [Limibaculum sp. FT325]|uniref:VOC family protein n=1 Tax=Thermohalobaculum sediminis TaxID=2939436 RepID=UPI0020BF8901|nr:VOC family protein [Limibaculum sediminis]MCL5778208.1 hypothetical protein [Limibaculum sediminis]
MHHSRLGVIVIDCRTDDLGPATAFWKGVLGVEGEVDADGRYAVLRTAEGRPKVLLQAVDHDPRIHIDFETEDQAAEAARIVALGGRVIGKVKRWTVMEAPTGHRFCLVNPQQDDFPAHAARWED